MNERIAELRKALKLTQTEFGQRLGVGKTAISKLEKGENSVTDQMFKSICREFNVSEEWLRNGTGEPLVSIDETQDAFIADILNDTNNPLKPVIHSILKTYSELNEKNKEVFEYILDEFIKNLGNGEK